MIVEHGLARGALAGARGLRAAGWDVDIGSPVPGLTTRSRAVSEWSSLPPLEAGVEPFLGAVRQAIRARGHEIVFAAGDAELLVISEHRESLDAIVPHPPHEVLLRGLDKLELMRAARAAGLDVPRTDALDGNAVSEFAHPVIVKPRLRLAIGELQPGRRLGTKVAATEEEVGRSRTEIEAAGGVPLIQERVTGVLTAWSAVADDRGKVLVEVQQDALRLWPPGGGVSARAVTVAVSPAISAAARALLEGISWSGLVQLQFIRSADGRARLIDLNPRFYGSMGLAIGAGANLPGIWAAAATGREPPLQPPRVGARYQWLTGDVQAIAAEPTRRKTELLKALRWAVGAHHSIWSVRDPAPAAWYVRHLMRSIAARARGKDGTPVQVT